MILDFGTSKMKRTAPLPKRVAQALARLRKRLPLSAPVRVALVDIPDAEHAIAMIDFRNERFQLAIDEALGEREMLEVLAHEWAHGVIWDVPDHRHHSDYWGVAYAKAYCIVFQTI